MRLSVHDFSTVCFATDYLRLSRVLSRKYVLLSAFRAPSAAVHDHLYKKMRSKSSSSSTSPAFKPLMMFFCSKVVDRVAMFLITAGLFLINLTSSVLAKTIDCAAIRLLFKSIRLGFFLD